MPANARLLSLLSAAVLLTAVTSARAGSRGDDSYHPPSDAPSSIAPYYPDANSDSGRAAPAAPNGYAPYRSPSTPAPYAAPAPQPYATQSNSSRAYGNPAADRDRDQVYRPPSANAAAGQPADDERRTPDGYRPLPGRQEPWRAADRDDGGERGPDRAQDRPRDDDRERGYDERPRDDRSRDDRPRDGGGYSGGYGVPYSAAPGPAAEDDRGPRRTYAPATASPTRGYYEQGEILDKGRGFFGSVAQGLASAVEYTYQQAGRPNGYILGEDGGGAFFAGLRYGEGTLFTKDAGDHKVYWQGPSLGYDVGGEGSKVMVLAYNLPDPSDVYHRFGGVEGSAYIVGGVSVQFQKHDDVTLAIIRSGVGLRLGANVGYLKYSRSPTWNPF